MIHESIERSNRSGYMNTRVNRTVQSIRLYEHASQLNGPIDPVIRIHELIEWSDRSGHTIHESIERSDGSGRMIHESIGTV